jgi:drug/metabolite transporter (DMT)-like permease
LKVATGQVTGSTLILLPICAVIDHPWALPLPSPQVWGAFAGIALLSTVFAYLLYFRILATAGATNLLLVTLLLPISALLLGWLALGETLTLKAFIGMAVIGAGLGCIDGRPLAWMGRWLRPRSLRPL